MSALNLAITMPCGPRSEKGLRPKRPRMRASWSAMVECSVGRVISPARAFMAATGPTAPEGPMAPDGARFVGLVLREQDAELEELPVFFRDFLERAPHVRELARLVRREERRARVGDPNDDVALGRPF